MLKSLCDPLEFSFCSLKSFQQKIFHFLKDFFQVESLEICLLIVEKPLKDFSGVENFFRRIF